MPSDGGRLNEEPIDLTGSSPEPSPAFVVNRQPEITIVDDTGGDGRGQGTGAGGRAAAVRNDDEVTFLGSNPRIPSSLDRTTTATTTTTIPGSRFHSFIPASRGLFGPYHRPTPPGFPPDLAAIAARSRMRSRPVTGFGVGVGVDSGPDDGDLEFVSGTTTTTTTRRGTPPLRRNRPFGEDRAGRLPDSTFSVGRNQLSEMIGTSVFGSIRDVFSRVLQQGVGAYQPPRPTTHRHTHTQPHHHHHHHHHHPNMPRSPASPSIPHYHYHRPPPPPPRGDPIQMPPTPEVPDGFEDSPKEDEVYVCCNCGEELCTGKDPAQQQVWIVRQCGHAYCGLCTKFRAKSKRPTSMVSPPPFRECVVDGCPVSTIAATSMFQIFI